MAQVRDFIGEHKAPLLFNSPAQPQNHFALALTSLKEAPLENLRGMIYRNIPNARILEITAPQGKDPLKQYREFLSEMLYILGEAPLHHGQETAIAARLPKILTNRYDYIIIDHAERMGAYSIESLRKDRGCPPVFLIAYDDHILDTLFNNEALLNKVFLLS
jgi:hypothetical protein